MFAELPCSLQSCAPASGETLAVCTAEQVHVPLDAGLRMAFPRVSGDRGSSNIRMDRLLANASPGMPPLSGLGCQAHCLHIAQGQVFGLEPSLISGCIALALAEQPAESVAKFREAIRTCDF